MKQRFFTTTIQSKFIQSLLYNTYLPVYNSVSKGDYIIEGFSYVLKDKIIRCTKSGILGERDGARFTQVMTYEFGRKYFAYTQNFVSKYNYYDSDTHKTLGKYLRLYRDYYGIDLMQFYNCFAGEYLDNIYKIDDEGFHVESNPDNKVFLVPLKFNKTYTIYLESPSDVYIAPIFSSNNSMVTYNVNGETEMLSSALISSMGGVTKKLSSSFTTPFTYKIDNTEQSSNMYQQFQDNERYLYIAIQTTKSNNSSLVVLEGDYTHAKTRKVFDASRDAIEEISDKELNSLLVSELKLSQLSDGVRYPFSDRLIEFLVENVITEYDEFEGDIIRIQDRLVSENDMSYIKGVWTRNMRIQTFNKMMTSSNTNKLDITGFIDKDAEKLIGGNK